MSAYSHYKSDIWQELIHDAGELLVDQFPYVNFRAHMRGGRFSSAHVVRTALGVTTMALGAGAELSERTLRRSIQVYKRHRKSTTSVTLFYMNDQTRAEAEWLSVRVNELIPVTENVEGRDSVLFAIFVALVYVIEAFGEPEESATEHEIKEDTNA